MSTITQHPHSSSPPGPLPIAGQARASVDPGFELRLIEGVRPIAEHYLASCLHHMFDRGIFDQLDGETEPVPIPSLAVTLRMDVHRLRGLLHFLANEAVVMVDGDAVALTPKGRQYGEFRPWYTMMIGGYGQTVGQIGQALAAGTPPCGRDGRYVGLGSCEMSRFDGMPITRTLLERAGLDCREVVDLGCGNGLSLVQLCRELADIRAWGAEPDRGGYDEAVALVDREHLRDRISLRNCSATEFLNDPPAGCAADLAVFSYVLQEVLAQEGESALVGLLSGLVDRFPGINVVVVEVFGEIENVGVMRHGLARNFWNPYYLLHYFTQQRLEKQEFWESLFGLAGLRVVDLITTDHAVDSTGLEVGYLLRRKEA
jgi:2-ketoarginine methyltransferase